MAATKSRSKRTRSPKSRPSKPRSKRSKTKAQLPPPVIQTLPPLRLYAVRIDRMHHESGTEALDVLEVTTDRERAEKIAAEYDDIGLCVPTLATVVAVVAVEAGEDHPRQVVTCDKRGGSQKVVVPFANKDQAYHYANSYNSLPGDRIAKVHEPMHLADVLAWSIAEGGAA